MIRLVLNDIYWASFKGNLVRVKELVEREGVDPTSAEEDPWQVSEEEYLLNIEISLCSFNNLLFIGT